MSEPIKELITQNIVTTLQGVTVEAGYHQTLDVKRADPAGLAMTPWACYVFALDDEEDNPHRVTGKECWVAPYVFAIYADIRDGDIADQVISRLQGDVQKAIMADHTRGGYAWNQEWKSPAKSTNEKGELTGTICTVEVKYRHKENDPYTK